VDHIVEIVLPSAPSRWSAEATRAHALDLELGKVIYLPQHGFALSPAEQRFLDPGCLSGSHKSVSYDPGRADSAFGLRGAKGDSADLETLAAMIARFRAWALALVNAVVPDYQPHLRVAPTSFRPGQVEGRKSSWRKDDTLLHVDAFPSRPLAGERILRVFANVNAGGVPRVWKIGDSFEQTARDFLPRVRPPLPGSRALLRALRVTKAPRTRFDHFMLGIHDQAKRDAAYQARASHLVFAFPPGVSWICFSDQVSHAALSGQHLLEQTLHLPLEAMALPEQSPLRILERLTGRALT
jgi:hypothetical protein